MGQCGAEIRVARKRLDSERKGCRDASIRKQIGLRFRKILQIFMNILSIQYICDFSKPCLRRIIFRQHAFGGVDEGDEFEIPRAGNLDDTRRIGDDGRQNQARYDSGSHNQQYGFRL